MRAKKSQLFAFVTAIGIAFAAPPAGSQPSSAEPTKEAREEAASRFRKGFELYKEGDFQAALIEFRRAYELAPNYNVLYNIGQVYYQLQDYANALNAFEKYLSDGKDQIQAKRKEEVQRDIDKLRARIANIEVTTNVPDVEITLDDVPVGKTPLAKPLVVSAGRHKIGASKEGFKSITKVLEVAGADSLKLPLTLAEDKVTVVAPPTASTSSEPPPPPPPTASASAAPPPPPPRSIPWVGWAITGATGAGTLITGVLALAAANDLKEKREGPGQTKPDLDAAASKVGTLALVSDILLGATVVAGGISLYLTVAGGSSDASEPAGDEAAPPGSGEPPKTQAKKPTVRIGLNPGGVSVFGSF